MCKEINQAHRNYLISVFETKRSIFNDSVKSLQVISEIFPLTDTSFCYEKIGTLRTYLDEVAKTIQNIITKLMLER